jgi:hypothetical protein
MTESADHPPLSRVELLVLGRISAKGATETEIAESLREIGIPLAEPDLTECVKATLASLNTLALVTVPTKPVPKPPTTAKRKSATNPQKATQPPPVPRFRRTKTGSVALRTALGVKATPTWETMSGRIVPVLALGEQPGSKAAARALASDKAMIASLLRRDRALGELTTVAQLCDQVIARALGMPQGPVTPDGIRAFALAMHCGASNKAELEGIAARFTRVKAPGATKGTKGLKRPKRAPLARELEALAEQLARKQLGVDSKDRTTIVQSLQRRWVSQLDEVDDAQRPSALRSAPLQPRPAIAERLASGPSSPLPAPDPDATEAMLVAVREAIPMVGSDGRYGKDNVFVSALWQQVARDHRLPALSLDGFKRWLVTANRDQLVALARADLVDDMDARLVEDSEIEYLGATFHFVLDRREPALGARAGTP